MRLPVVSSLISAILLYLLLPESIAANGCPDGYICTSAAQTSIPKSTTSSSSYNVSLIAKLLSSTGIITTQSITNENLSTITQTVATATITSSSLITTTITPISTIITTSSTTFTTTENLPITTSQTTSITMITTTSTQSLTGITTTTENPTATTSQTASVTMTTTTTAAVITQNPTTITSQTLSTTITIITATSSPQITTITTQNPVTSVDTTIPTTIITTTQTPTTASQNLSITTTITESSTIITNSETVSIMMTVISTTSTPLVTTTTQMPPTTTTNNPTMFITMAAETSASTFLIATTQNPTTTTEISQTLSTTITMTNNTVAITTQLIVNDYYVEFSFPLNVSDGNITDTQLLSQLLSIFTTTLDITSNQINIIIITSVSSTTKRVIAQVRFFNTASENADDLLIRAQRQLVDPSSKIRQGSLISQLTKNSIENVKRYYSCSNGVVQESSCDTNETSKSGTSLTFILLASIIPSVIALILLVVIGSMFIIYIRGPSFTPRMSRFDRF